MSDTQPTVIDPTINPLITPRTTEDYLTRNWRNYAALVYFAICVVDFIVMPIMTFFWHEPFKQLAGEIANLPPDIQRQIVDKSTIFWSPITIAGMGIIHIAFGAILGITSWGKSSERVNQIQQAGTTQRTLLMQRQAPLNSEQFRANMVRDRQ